jgi:hypothetical protein
VIFRSACEVSISVTAIDLLAGQGRGQLKQVYTRCKRPAADVLSPRFRHARQDLRSYFMLCIPYCLPLCVSESAGGSPAVLAVKKIAFAKIMRGSCAGSLWVLKRIHLKTGLWEKQGMSTLGGAGRPRKPLFDDRNRKRHVFDPVRQGSIAMNASTRP